MATVVITPTQLTINTAQTITAGAGLAINASNTNTIAYPKHGKLLLIVSSTHANTAVYVAAGNYVAAGKGALDATAGAITAANGVMRCFFLETDRFKDSSGNVNLTYHADSTGFVQAYYIPVEA